MRAGWGCKQLLGARCSQCCLLQTQTLGGLKGQVLAMGEEQVLRQEMGQGREQVHHLQGSGENLGLGLLLQPRDVAAQPLKLRQKRCCSLLLELAAGLLWQVQTPSEAHHAS